MRESQTGQILANCVLIGVQSFDALIGCILDALWMHSSDAVFGCILDALWMHTGCTLLIADYEMNAQ